MRDLRVEGATLVLSAITVVACTRHNPTAVLPTVQPAHDVELDRMLPPPSRDFSRCCGTERASLGSLFGKLTLGRVEPRPTLPSAAQLGFAVSFEMNGQRIDGVVVHVDEDELCTQLDDHLVKIWGPPGEIASHTGWQDRAHDRAATFDRLGVDCELRFYRLVSPQRWLSWSRDSVVPVWAVGKPVAELRAALAALDVTSEENFVTHEPELRWADVSIDGERVGLTAYFHRGQVTGVRVAGAYVWPRLEALLGPPDTATTHEDLTSWRWHRKPGIELSAYTAYTPPGVNVAVPPEFDTISESVLFGVE